MTFKNPRVSTVSRAFRVIPPQDRRKIFIVIALQFLLGILDLAGVAAIGVLGALAVTGVQSQQPGNRVSSVLDLLQLESLTFQGQAAALGIIATLILVARTFFSILITRRIFYFLSRRGAVITSELMSKLLSQSILTIQSRSIQDNLYSITTGVGAVTLGIIGGFITLLADASLLLILLLGLTYVDPIMALITFIFFGSLGWVLYRIMNVKARELGRKNFELAILSNQKIIEVLESYRESVVHDRRSFYSSEIRKLRLRLSDVLAETQFMPNVSKYILESGIVIGAVFIAGAQFLLQDARHAVATLAIFLASGSRIAPAVMRIQQSAIQMRTSLGAAEPTLNMMDQFESVINLQNDEREIVFSYEGFSPVIKLSGVSFTYPGASQPAIRAIDLTIEPGHSVAIVGPSGSGKTTLVDVLLGVLEPEKGEINVSHMKPIQAIAKWPGAISYVPQDVKIIEGSFRENVALGYPAQLATDQTVMSALANASLLELVQDSEFGLDSSVGESGAKISGGQRQRLGIARAFFTKPRLIVLDEATSALDGSTEFEITNNLSSLKGEVTVVTIAHRLSTVRDSDLVVYLDGGQILASGSFDQVRLAVPDFDNQAKLMGL
jgi:ABC-type multidrug transport system fused ATPase/permease subunit